MNCRQCGAPMELIRERDYYHCLYCGSYYFPEDSPDGVRMLGENEEGLDCPLCRVVLNVAIFDDYYRGYRCGNCQGILFNRTTFRKTIELRRGRTMAPAEPPLKYHEEELQREVFCPICSREMSVHKYMGPGNIIIDTCNDCDLIWLDYGELRKVVAAPGKDRGEWRVGANELHADETKPLKDGEKKRGRFESVLLALLEDLIGR